MVDDSAISVGSAATRARVGTGLLEAGSVRGTLRADHALRSASWRTSYVFKVAGAHGLSVLHLAEAVGSAGRRVTRVLRHDRCKSRTLAIRIPPTPIPIHLDSLKRRYLFAGISRVNLADTSLVSCGITMGTTLVTKQAWL